MQSPSSNVQVGIALFPVNSVKMWTGERRHKLLSQRTQALFPASVLYGSQLLIIRALRYLVPSSRLCGHLYTRKQTHVYT